ncbi:hypothetical protein BDY19DRAFT_960739 [Irpex rosettiformis]|uniref:Uncharacterized protein n=1 Tax=Irpex rosettiformis TaxID=378272 RepID=A0ACB8TWE0_9APHY|nr:hypothetical protein BDY19DRAFT_960739 [Irpex rosettiformis]
MLHPIVVDYLIVLGKRWGIDLADPCKIKESDSLVLKCSDGAMIPASRKMLSMASDTFGDGPDIIDVQEHSETIDALLSFLYPINDPTIKTIEANVAILEAAKKYGMSLVQERAREQLEIKAKSQPLQVYAIALSKARASLEDEIRMAAKFSLMHALDPWSETLPIEFEHVSGRDYARLLDYHRACKDAVGELFKEETKERSDTVYSASFLCDHIASLTSTESWLFRPRRGKSYVRILLPTPLSKGDNVDEPQKAAPHKVYAPSWWVDWMVKTIDRLKQKPHPDVVTDESFMELLVKAISMHPHESNVPDVIGRFKEVFVRAVDEAVGQVSF